MLQADGFANCEDAKRRFGIDAENIVAGWTEQILNVCNGAGAVAVQVRAGDKVLTVLDENVAVFDDDTVKFNGILSKGCRGRGKQNDDGIKSPMQH
ncbi:MAG: hypothetical protein HOK71_17745 [Planctomycetaceae bacterium]|nr:hypothetical protein [Planctomycetaceae bacterium]